LGAGPTTGCIERGGDKEMGSSDMTIEEQIEDYIAGQAGPKRDDMRALHHLILDISPDCRLWFLDGKDDDGKTLSNPNIGYGFQTIDYANGKSREFFQIGVSANTTGISIYIIGIEDKKYLSLTFGEKLGKASVTGYCIKFKSLKDLNLEVVEDMIRFGFEARGGKG
jgi:hypothetical protein